MHLWILFSRKIPHSQRKRSEDNRGHHHADRSYRSCAAQYVSAAQKILFTLFGREYNVYLIFRDIGRAAFPSSVSPAGRLPAYTEPVPLWKKSPSFCAALRNSVESDVYKYATL